MLLQNSAPQKRGGLAAPGTLLVILVTLMLLAGERMSLLEAKFFDFLQQQYPATASDRILIVDTGSSESDEKIYDKTRFTPVVDALNAAGAALIVPLEEPPANTELPDIQQLTALAELERRARKQDQANAIDEATLAIQLKEIRRRQEQQAEIAATLENAGNIILPVIPRPTRGALENAKDDCARHAFDSEALGPDNLPWARESSGTLTLPQVLCSGALNAGYAGYWADSDGIVRRNHLLVKSGRRLYPSLPLAVAEADRQVEFEISAANGLRSADEEWSTGPGFSNLIRYYTPKAGAETFPVIAADALLDSGDVSKLVEDHIVLVGDMSGADIETFRTPLGQSMPLPVLAATTLSNLLQMDFVSRPGWLGGIEIALLLILGIAILLSAPGLSANRAAGAALVLGFLLLAIEAFAMVAYGVWIQLVTATVFTLLGIGSLQTLASLRTSAGATGESSSSPAAKSSVPNVDEEAELDLAFSVLRQQSPTDETKRRLYDIAMQHGKRREYAKAERVFAYIDSIDSNYKDVKEKLSKLSGARQSSSQQAAKSALPKRVASTKSANDTDARERKLDRYIIEKTVGRGAMATVYLGRDPKINRKVAIKTIALAEEFSDADLEAAKSQFIREAESAGRLNHPNIITIYDTGEDGNIAYLAMEYFAGKAMNFYTQPENLLPPKWVLELAARAADALHYAHGQGVVHRDIKPANLMYDAASDELRITDFGIARLTDTSRTKTGIILGTPSFMSPEQLAASSVTGSSDLYSLGITIYQLLTGTTPFRSDSIPKLMDKIMNDQATPPSTLRDDIPTEVDVVLEKVLAKRPEDRYPNGRAMALALRDCCSTLDA